MQLVTFLLILEGCSYEQSQLRKWVPGGKRTNTEAICTHKCVYIVDELTYIPNLGTATCSVQCYKAMPANAEHAAVCVVLPLFAEMSMLLLA